MRPTRYFYFLSVLVMLVVLSKVGCVAVNLGGSSSPAAFKETRSLAAPAADSVVVRTQNGEVKVRRGESPDVSIVARVAAQTQKRLDGVRVVAERQSNGELLVTADWPGGRPQNNEGCAFEIEVPSATDALQVATDNGAVTIESLSGPARVHTTNGRIVVTDHHGPVDAHTTNGMVRLANVTGEAGAYTTNGKVEVSGAAGPVTAHTSNGAVSVALADNAPGPVDIQTTNGSADLKLPKSYTGRLSLSTSNGAIRYPSGPTIHDLSASRTHATLAIGHATAESRIATSNGSIDVRIAD